ncbi:hypothetical protein [Pseudomonas sp. NFX183]|uniref:hypothetical protein n=1 Tax=Pseudomonas sp. NFX183 TaxID=3399573 RepID=UPI003A5C6311
MACSYLLAAPGWVRTQMGGPGARLEIGESSPLVVDIVEARRCAGPDLHGSARRDVTLVTLARGVSA